MQCGTTRALACRRLHTLHSLTIRHPSHARVLTRHHNQEILPILHASGKSCETKQKNRELNFDGHASLTDFLSQDWDWFNGRNFCRERCMDLVSFEDPEEYRHFAKIMHLGESTPKIKVIKP
jgi:hypothetical protein